MRTLHITKIVLGAALLNCFIAQGLGGDFYLSNYPRQSGESDDQPRIQRALNAAINDPNPPATVHFETNSIYYLTTTYIYDNKTYLNCEKSTPFTVNLDGRNASLVADSGTSENRMFRFGGFWQNSYIRNVNFTNLHGLTTSPTVGIHLSCPARTDGVKPMTNITIAGCKLSGFACGMDFDGAQTVRITNNIFAMPAGHDSGTYSDFSYPNVGIRLLPGPGNSTATRPITRDFLIANNSYNGCSGSLANTQTRRCGDGLVAGSAVKLEVASNVITNFDAEAIVLFLHKDIWDNIVLADELSTVHHNAIDNTAYGPMGYGIRADVPGVEVAYNTINKVVCGLHACYEWLGGTSDATGLNFHNNTLVVGESNSTWWGQRNAVGIDIIGISASQFSNNYFTLTGGSSYGLMNIGIYATGSSLTGRTPSSGLAFTYNTFIATGGLQNGYWPISFFWIVLNNPQTQFVDNCFLSLQYDVFPSYYPMSGYSFPNNQSNDYVKNLVRNANYFGSGTACP
jgi:hypothetical protein